MFSLNNQHFKQHVTHWLCPPKLRFWFFPLVLGHCYSQRDNLMNHNHYDDNNIKHYYKNKNWNYGTKYSSSKNNTKPCWLELEEPNNNFNYFPTKIFNYYILQSVQDIHLCSVSNQIQSQIKLTAHNHRKL